ncbi:MAG: nicotinate-nucleotide adenylyltransferase, partial [Abditibacteriota bacterium]|nr:nicotinate-nucleotide adenylyltransferase [Abditibacteriota bacterium]
MQGIKRLGIMGGTFDPIHTAHLALAEAARERFRLDKVLFVLSANPPHKAVAGMTPAPERYEMVKLAIQGNPSFEACDLELRRQEPSYTVDTLRELETLYPAWEKYLIVGIDEARNFCNWRSWETILESCTVAAAWRPGFPQLETELPIVSFEAPLMQISSSDIRERAALGKSFRYLVPDCIYEYITE